MEKEISRQKTKRDKKKIELKYEARKSQSAVRTPTRLKTFVEQAVEAGTGEYFFEK